MTDQNNLSGREIEILKLVATGLTNREIAQELTISPNTVKVHLRNIFEKISVASRTEATLYGIEHGLVDVPGGLEVAEPAPPTWQDELRKYAWIGVPLAVLVIVFLVTFTFNILLPPPTPESQALAELAERWTSLAPMPAARAGMAAAAYDGEIYAIAGEGPEGVSGSVFNYSPEGDIWAQLSDKPTPVADVHGALIGERIYVPGGRRADGEPTDILEIYDPRRDSWSMGAPLPQAVSAYALVGFEGQMYLFGGWDGTQALDVVYVYDPQTDAWQEGTAMPTARYYAGAAQAGGKIFVFGGWDGDQVFDISESYLPARDQNQEVAWNTEAPMPIPLYAMSTIPVTDIIFFVGGRSPNENETGLFYYSHNQNSWFQEETPGPQGDPISFSSSVAIGGLIYNFGGRLGERVLARSQSYQAIFTISLPGIIN